MENKPLILLVEDEESVSSFISSILTSNDYNVVVTSKGKDAILMAASYYPDLILLNLGLPDIKGIEVLKSIRIWTNLPVIILSKHRNELEKVEAFDAGADDFIAKPFGTPEFLARIRTALRHGQFNTDLLLPKVIGELKIDFSRRVVSIVGKEIHLTPIEYKIIVLLSQHLGKVLPHDLIIKEIWGPYTRETYSSELQALRVNMANIRKKLEINPAEPRYIITEVGVGYRMIE